MTYWLPMKARRWMDPVTVTGEQMSLQRTRGFTLIEVLVVVMLIAILAAIAVPVVSNSVEKAREAALKENLFQMRKSLDDYLADNGRYPAQLEQLVSAQYLRYLPEDPVLETPEVKWALAYTDYQDGSRGILDVRSTSSATASDGSRFDTW